MPRNTQLQVGTKLLDVRGEVSFGPAVGAANELDVFPRLWQKMSDTERDYGRKSYRGIGRDFPQARFRGPMRLQCRAEELWGNREGSS
jgi:hypothetical protein